MTFKYIDDDAFPLNTSDGPHAAFGAVGMFNNVKAVHDERWPRVAIAFPETDYLTVSAAWPTMVLGPLYIRLPRLERFRLLTIRLRAHNVTWSPGATEPSAGTDAIRVAFTTAPFGERPVAPRAALSDTRWTTLQVSDDDLSDFTFTIPIRATGGVIDEPRAGWHGIYMWVWSEIDSSSEDTGTFVDLESRFGAAVVNGLSPASTTNPVHRAVTVSPVDEKGGGTAEEGQFYQVQLYDNGAAPLSDDVVYCMPPLGPLRDDAYASGSGQVAIFTMGVLEVQSVAIEAIPDTFPLRVESMYSAEPITWRNHQGLAEQANRLAEDRVSTLSCGNPLVRNVPTDITAQREQWRLIGNELPGSQTLSTSASTPNVLHSAFDYELHSDDSGYVGVVSLYGMALGPEIGRIFLRVAAYDTSGTLIASATGDWNAFDMAFQRYYLGVQHWPWSPIQEGVWQALRQVGWQFRGALIHEDTTMGQQISADKDDFALVHHFAVTCRAPSSAPCVPVIEMYADSSTFAYDTDKIDICVVGAGIALRNLVELDDITYAQLVGITGTDGETKVVVEGGTYIWRDAISYWIRKEADDITDADFAVVARIDGDTLPASETPAVWTDTTQGAGTITAVSPGGVDYIEWSGIGASARAKSEFSLTPTNVKIMWQGYLIVDSTGTVDNEVARVFRAKNSQRAIRLNWAHGANSDMARLVTSTNSAIGTVNEEVDFDGTEHFVELIVDTAGDVEVYIDNKATPALTASYTSFTADGGSTWRFGDEGDASPNFDVEFRMRSFLAFRLT